MNVYAISNDEDAYEDIENLQHNHDNPYLAMGSVDVVYDNASNNVIPDHENPYLTMVSAEVVNDNTSNNVKDVTGKLQRKSFCSCKILTRKQKMILCGVITLILTIWCLVCGFSFLTQILEEEETTLPGKIYTHSTAGSSYSKLNVSLGIIVDHSLFNYLQAHIACSAFNIIIK